MSPTEFRRTDSYITGIESSATSNSMTTSLSSNPQPSNSSAHLLGLPTELRRNIFELALVAETSMFREPYHTIARPFDRPVVVVNLDGRIGIARSHDPSYGSFWGSESMTRLMRVNKLFYEEVFDIIYSTFGIYVPFWRLDKEIGHWIRWLKEHNPRALHKIRHFCIFSCLYGDEFALGIWSYPNDQCIQIVENFGGLKSVTIQVLFIESSLEELKKSLLPKYVDTIVAQAKSWRAYNVRANISIDPCSGPRGRALITEAQKRLGQRQVEPSVYDQGVRCDHEKPVDSLGCGYYQ